MTSRVEARHVAALVTGVALLVAVVLRVIAAHVLGPHVDEAETVLAARIVSRDGVPLLPSGVLYLQGATLSVLLQPLLRLAADPLDLFPFRLASVAAGALVVPMTYRLARLLGARRAAAAFAACAIALDPGSIEWSAHVRPYALLQLLTVTALVLWLRALVRPAASDCMGLAVVLALGVFTHIGILMLLPSMLLVTAMRMGFRSRGLWLALFSIALPTALLLGLNAWFRTSTSGAFASGPSFIGDHIVDVQRVYHPKLYAWRWLFPVSGARDLVIPLVAGAIGLLLARGIDERRTERAGVVTALVLYALPILAVTFFTSEARARYLIHVHPLTWVLVGLALRDLACDTSRSALDSLASRAVAAGGTAVVAVHLVDGTYTRLESPEVDPSYQRALAWLAPQHSDGELVISAMTAVAWLAPIPLEDVRFLAGPEGGPRSNRYTRVLDGEVVDYWAGVPAVASTPDLCAILDAHPGSWLVVDVERLRGEWALAGPVAEVVVGASTLAFQEPDGARVYRSLPRPEWMKPAVDACAREPVPPPPP